MTTPPVNRPKAIVTLKPPKISRLELSAQGIDLRYHKIEPQIEALLI
jgi:hypothetical protein